MSSSLQEPLNSEYSRVSKRIECGGKFVTIAVIIILIIFVASCILVGVSLLKDPSVKPELEASSDSNNILTSISYDSRYLAFGSGSGKIEVWEIDSKSKLTTFETDGPIKSLMISPYNVYLISSQGMNVYIFNLETLSLTHTFVHSSRVVSVLITGDNEKLIVLCEDSSLLVYNLETYSLFHQFQDTGSDINAFDIDSYSQILAVGTQNGIFSLWNIKNKSLISTLDLQKPIKKIKIGESTLHVMISLADGSYNIYDIDLEQVISTYTPDYKVNTALISESSNYIVLVGEKIRIYDLESNYEVNKFEISDKVTSLAISRDGRNLFSATDSEIKVWSTFSGSQLASLICKEGTWNIGSIEISGDYKYLLTGGKDGKVRLFSFYA